MKNFFTSKQFLIGTLIPIAAGIILTAICVIYNEDSNPHLIESINYGTMHRPRTIFLMGDTWHWKRYYYIQVNDEYIDTTATYNLQQAETYYKQYKHIYEYGY